MATHKVVYRWSQDYAKRYDELDQWRESYKENCTCARAIEKAINENYQDMVSITTESLWIPTRQIKTVIS